jgi:hypothetical protein
LWRWLSACVEQISFDVRIQFEVLAGVWVTWAVDVLKKTKCEQLHQFDGNPLYGVLRPWVEERAEDGIRLGQESLPTHFRNQPKRIVVQKPPVLEFDKG